MGEGYAAIHRGGGLPAVGGGGSSVITQSIALVSLLHSSFLSKEAVPATTR
jgi:hypothetical protein